MISNSNQKLKAKRHLRNLLFLSVISVFISPLFHGCGEDPTEGEIYDLEGIVQKGPFIQGTSITIYELNDDLEQTGRSYETITNNAGKFSLSGATFVSPYVRLKANGYYFNERTGHLSPAQLTLYCLANITESDHLNINILSHLECERIIHLVGEGLSFKKAKKKALNELLTILAVDETGISNPELMDISESGNGNGVLLAASVIFQYDYRTGEFTEFLNKFAADLKDDGDIDDELLGKELVASGERADPDKIRSNLEDRYTELGEDFSLPEFEGYITNFIENSLFVAGFCMGCDSSTVEDIDGNIYKTIKIGDQWWMAENLKVAHYSGGDEITLINDSTIIMNPSTTIGAFSYPQLNPSDAEIYGNLYNWYAVIDERNVCPAGWHVPSRSEFQELADGLGGKDLAGGKLKSTTDDWLGENVGATNKTGFNALPAGEEWPDYPGWRANFWTTNNYNDRDAYVWYLNANNESFSEGNREKYYYFSVRCVKD